MKNFLTVEAALLILVVVLTALWAGVHVVEYVTDAYENSVVHRLLK